MAEKKLTAAIIRRGGMTGLEKKVFTLLGGKGSPWGFIPQFPLHGYILDFYSPEWKVAVEADGPVHVNRKAADAKREQILLGYGVRTLHITPADIRLNGAVKNLEYIQNFMLAALPETECLD